jgi:hypothetical protein
MFPASPTSSSAPPPVLSRASSQDVFHRLPNELRLKIIKASPDLSSLASFIDASPTMSALFDTYSLEVFEAVMAATVPACIQSLMRAVLRVQVSSAWSCYYHGVEEMRNLSLKSSPPLEVADTYPPELLRCFLVLAHRIHMLAHSCIDHYIQRSMAMTPSSLIKLGPYGGAFGPPIIHFGYKRAESRPYQLQTTGPPSWVEEQRVVKSFWRIQLFLELKLARKEDRLGWTDKDLEMLDSTTLTSFYNIISWELDQILTVWEFIQELGSREDIYSNSISRLPTPILGKPFNPDCALQPSLDLKEDYFQQGERYLDQASGSCRFQRFMARDPKHSPLPGLPFEPYRKFGFAIWDDKRMTDLGFAAPQRKALLRTIEYYYVWYSVLTEEESVFRGP